MIENVLNPRAVALYVEQLKEKERQSLAAEKAAKAALTLERDLYWDCSTAAEFHIALMNQFKSATYGATKALEKKNTVINRTIEETKKLQKVQKQTKGTIVVDMDGTIADLTSVKNAYRKLDALKTGPYEQAGTLIDPTEFNRAVAGFKVVVITWLSKATTKLFDDLSTYTKKDWLKRNNFNVDEFYAIPYGTNKSKFAESKGIKNATLYDDDRGIRESWELGKTINPITDDLHKSLTNKKPVLKEAGKEAANEYVLGLKDELKKSLTFEDQALQFNRLIRAHSNDALQYATSPQKQEKYTPVESGKTLSDDMFKDESQALQYSMAIQSLQENLTNLYKSIGQSQVDMQDTLFEMTPEEMSRFGKSVEERITQYTTWNTRIQDTEKSLRNMLNIMEASRNNSPDKVDALQDLGRLTKETRYNNAVSPSKANAYDFYDSSTLQNVASQTERIKNIVGETATKYKEIFDDTKGSSRFLYRDESITNIRYLENSFSELIKTLRGSEIASSDFAKSYNLVNESLIERGPLSKAAVNREISMRNYKGDTLKPGEDFSTRESKSDYLGNVAKQHQELTNRLNNLKKIIFTGALNENIKPEQLEPELQAIKDSMLELKDMRATLNEGIFTTDALKDYADMVTLVSAGVDDLIEKTQGNKFRPDAGKNPRFEKGLMTYKDPSTVNRMSDEAYNKYDRTHFRVQQDDTIERLLTNAQQAKSSIDNIRDELLTDIKNLNFDFVSVGVELPAGLAMGIEGNSSKAAEASSAMGQKSVDALKDTLQVHSPSVIGRHIGENFTEGYFEGLEKNARGNRMAEIYGKMLDLFKKNYESMVISVMPTQEGRDKARASLERSVKEGMSGAELLGKSNSIEGIQKFLKAISIVDDSLDVMNLKGKAFNADKYAVAAKNVEKLSAALRKVKTDEDARQKEEQERKAAEAYKGSNKFNLSHDTIAKEASNVEILKKALTDTFTESKKTSELSLSWDVVSDALREAILQIQILKNEFAKVPEGGKQNDVISGFTTDFEQMMLQVSKVSTPDQLITFMQNLTNLTTRAAQARGQLQEISKEGDTGTTAQILRTIDLQNKELTSTLQLAMGIDKKNIADKQATDAQKVQAQTAKKTEAAQKASLKNLNLDSQAKNKNTSAARRNGNSHTNLTAGLRRFWYSLRRITSGANNFTRRLFSMANGFNIVGKTSNLLRSAFAAITGMYVGTELKDVIKYSVDYVEILELFRVATSGAADEAARFVDTMEDVYGLDPNTIMQAVGTFSELTNAINMPSNTASKMSMGLAKKGVDLASLFNTQYEDVISDLTSGLQGMTKAVRKYGIDIRVSTLQTRAQSLGMTELVADMTEADREGLRYLQMLDNTSNSAGNFAKTIESVANQFKIAKEQTIGLLRAIGNLFMPMLQKYMYQLNAYLMTLKTVFTYIGLLVGFKPQYFDPNTEEQEDYNASLDETAKKLNRLAGFDELEILQNNASDDDEVMNDAIIQAIAEYESIMEEFTMKAETMRRQLLEALGFTDTGDGTFDINFNFDTDQWETTVTWLGIVGTTISSLVTQFQTMGPSITSAWSNMTTELSAFFKPVLDIFKEMFGISTLSDVDEWLAGLKFNLERFSFKSFFQKIIDGVIEYGPKLALEAVNMVGSLLDGLVKALASGSNMQKIGLFVLDLGKALGEKATNLFDGALVLLAKMFEGMSTRLTDGSVSSDITKFVTNLMSSIAKSGPEIINGALNLAVAIIQGLVGALADSKFETELIVFVLDFANAMVTAVGALANFGVNLMSKILTQLIEATADQSTMEGIASFVGNLLGTIVGAFTNLLTQVAKFITTDIWKTLLGGESIDWGSIFVNFGESFITGFKTSASSLFTDITGQEAPGQKSSGFTLTDKPSFLPTLEELATGADYILGINDELTVPKTLPEVINPIPQYTDTGTDNVTPKPVKSDWQIIGETLGNIVFDSSPIQIDLNNLVWPKGMLDTASESTSDEQVTLLEKVVDRLDKIFSASNGQGGSVIMIDERVFGQLVKDVYNKEVTNLGYSTLKI